MMEKGLKKPVKLKTDLAAFCNASELPRLEITKKLWDHIKAKKLQAKTVNGGRAGSGLEKAFGNRNQDQPEGEFPVGG
jgi:hypothetical protein